MKLTGRKYYPVGISLRIMLLATCCKIRPAAYLLSLAPVRKCIILTNEWIGVTITGMTMRGSRVGLWLTVEHDRCHSMNSGFLPMSEDTDLANRSLSYFISASAMIIGSCCHCIRLDCEHWLSTSLSTWLRSDTLRLLVPIRLGQPEIYTWLVVVEVVDSCKKSIHFPRRYGYCGTRLTGFIKCHDCHPPRQIFEEVSTYHDSE